MTRAPGAPAQPRVLVVQHEDGCPVDRLGGWLAELGIGLDVVRPDTGLTLPDELTHEALVVLGGHTGAHDDDEAPWLPATRRLLAQATGAGRPVLGICLGAQLLAAATGGRVEVGGRGIEAGVIDVSWQVAAADDPLIGADAPTAAPSMHLDAVVDLPPDATWLGSSASYPHQAFRVGERAWGVQYHPEVSLLTYTRWAAGHAGDWDAWGIDGDEVVAQLARRDAEVVRAGRRLASRFAAVVRQSALERTGPVTAR